MSEEPPVDGIQQCAEKLGKKENADVLLINGSFDYDLQEMVLEAIKSRKQASNKPNKLIFILATPGGLPDVAYRMSRVIQSTYETSHALVGGWCKSAGTLFLIGANSIVMNDNAELGPLDIQLAKRDEINERDSGLVIDEALDNMQHYAYGFFNSFLRQIKHTSQGMVTLRMASEISANITKGLFEPIYRQIDPQKIGEVARSMAIGEAYGRRLNLKPKNLRQNALQNLLSGYPSHGFVIDREEAKLLFKSVKEPTPEELELLVELGALAIEPCRQPVVRLFEIKSEEISDEKHVEAATKPTRPSRKIPISQKRQGRTIDT